MRGMFRWIDLFERLERHTLALHLVEQFGEAVGEVEGGRLGGDARFGLDQPRDEARELQLAPKGRYARCQTGGHQWIGGEIADHPDPRQEPRRPGGEGLAQAALGAPGVDPDRHARRRVGRLPFEAGIEPGDEAPQKIRTGGQTEDARAVAGREEPGHA